MLPCHADTGIAGNLNIKSTAWEGHVGSQVYEERKIIGENPTLGVRKVIFFSRKNYLRRCQFYRY
jgi:hypothetical protein